MREEGSANGAVHGDLFAFSTFSCNRANSLLFHFFEKTPTPMDSGLDARYSFTPGRDSIRFIHSAMVFWVDIQ